LCHLDFDFLLLTRAQPRSAVAAAMSAAGVEVARPHDVPVAGAAAACAVAARGEAAHALARNHRACARQTVDGLLDVVVLRQEILDHARSARLAAAERVEPGQRALVLHLLADDVFLALGNDGVLRLRVLAADLALFTLHALGLTLVLALLALFGIGRAALVF